MTPLMGSQPGGLSSHSLPTAHLSTSMTGLTLTFIPMVLLLKSKMDSSPDIETTWNVHAHGSSVEIQDGFILGRPPDSEPARNVHLLEMARLHEYRVFKDLGLGGLAPPDCLTIRVHLCFDVKHDDRHKARLVAGGHLTPVPDVSIYSTVVSLQGLQVLLFLAELDDLQTWASYVAKMRHAVIRYRTGEPDFSALPEQTFDWEYLVYGNVKEFVPKHWGYPQVRTFLRALLSWQGDTTDLFEEF